jgi:hypothetical protein
MEIDRDDFEQAVAEWGEAITVMETYSGRFMFGEQCLAVAGSIRDLIAFSLRLGSDLHPADIRALAPDIQIDQFGKGHVAYFPGRTLTERPPSDRA